MATLSTMIERVQNELDLQDEDFIKSDEITTYINSGIKSAANIILNLYEDYFLDSVTGTLVMDQGYIDLPTNIWAQKIRRILYNNGSKKRIITRIKKLEDTILLQNTEDYRYMVTNNSTNGLRINLYPTPRESGSYLTIWYIREARALTSLTDILDIPEGEDYVVQYAKDKCKNKEAMSPDAPPSAALKEQEDLLVSGLMNRFPDDDNDIEPNLSFYEEHS